MTSTEPRVALDQHLESLACSHLADATDAEIAEAMGGMIAHPDYPCVGARSVAKRGTAQVLVLDAMDDEASITALRERLGAFAAQPRGPRDFASCLAVFRHPVPEGEEGFERRLWHVLQRLHDGDDQPWAGGVSSDPQAPDFAFSVGGTPFFVVGLHPAASRIARRAPLATLVFNLHVQFEQLRADGAFERMRDTVRRRDERVQGTVNPMADDHGGSSEARQYAGRLVDDDWRAPFVPKEIR